MKSNSPIRNRLTALPGDARRGFSLVELLTVMTVIGILATIAVPAMSNGSNFGLKAAGRVLASDLRMASDLAVQYGTQYTITFDLTKNQYQLTLTGPGNPPTLQNPQAPPGTPAGTYLISIGLIDGNTTDSNGVRLLGAKLKTGGQSVTNISFGSQGGTGPTRTDDTEIWLIDGPTWNPQYLRLTVTAITGQVWVDRPTMYPAPSAN
jgi:prepilin-type N-terminal cleavage/methylation domain-containing protein